MTSEQDRNKRTQDIVESFGGYIVKVISANKSGVHDMLACIPDSKNTGRFCSLEGKLDYNEMSKLQIAHKNKVILAGGLARVIKTDEDLYIIHQQVMEGYIQTISEEEKQLTKLIL